MEKKQNTPALRFRGFSGEWEKTKLGEISTSFSGGTPAVGVKEYYSGKIPFIRSAEINAKKTELHISELGLANSSAKLVKKGDILYALYGATSGEVGRAQLVGAINQAILVIRLKENYDEDYLVAWLKRSKIHILDTYLQGGQGNLSGEIVKNLDIILPESQEQRHIGKIFTNLEKFINREEQKIQKLQQFRQAMLTKLFPREGAAEPELRFAGFSGPWERKKLGDVVEVIMGQSPDGDTYSTIPCGHILVQGNADLENGWVKPRIWTTQVTKTATAGDLIMSVRAPAGAMGKTAYDVVLGRGVAAIKGNAFIYHSLVKMDSMGYWSKYASGSTFESLNSNNIQEAEISIPSEAEQEVLGTFFDNIDETISLQQKKLEQMRRLKAALLEKLFV